VVARDAREKKTVSACAYIRDCFNRAHARVRTNGTRRLLPSTRENAGLPRTRSTRVRARARALLQMLENHRRDKITFSSREDLFIRTISRTEKKTCHSRACCNESNRAPDEMRTEVSCSAIDHSPLRYASAEFHYAEVRGEIRLFRRINYRCIAIRL